jgi:hypothetical protein
MSILFMFLKIDEFYMQNIVYSRFVKMAKSNSCMILQKMLSL